MTSAGKVTAAVFWNRKGVLVTDFLKMGGGAAINAAAHGVTQEYL